MKKSRFTTEQIIGFIKQADAGMAASELARQNGFRLKGQVHLPMTDEAHPMKPQGQVHFPVSIWIALKRGPAKRWFFSRSSGVRSGIG